MTFDFWVTQRWLLNGSAASSDRIWSRYRSASAGQRDSHQRDPHCRSSHWEATASLVSAVPIHSVVIHRNRRRKFVAATRRSLKWHQTAVTIGKRELIAKARKRKPLKLWQWVERNGQMSLGCRRLGWEKVKEKRAWKTNQKWILISIWSLFWWVVKLTHGSFPESFWSFLAHNFPRRVNNSGVSRLSRSCDNLKTRFDDVSGCDEWCGGNAGDGTSGE